MNQQKATKSKLEDLDFSEDLKYEAFSEKKEIKFDKCSHSDVGFKNGNLVCKCGAGWSGPRLQELFDFLTKKN